MAFQERQDWLGIPTPPFTTFVISGRLTSLSLHFLNLKMEFTPVSQSQEDEGR